MTIKHLETNKKFTHVAHIADCHIRLTKRHQEYREVFNRLFESIKNTPETSVVFILGDVVNNKNQLSPECVDLTAEFLFNLASIRPTILVAGNHDLLLTNQNRMDSLSPIVTTLNHSNLFYLKQSSLYSFGNICINNYSVFDNPENYIKGSDIPDIYRNEYEYFIVTYHGQVDGAITDLGFRLNYPPIKLKDFDSHDIILCGDIHLQQTLQKYDYQNNKPTIRFCGSLCQQNHAESIKGHGYTLWDLKEKTYNHIEIPNDYGFFSVGVENGIITTDLTNIPKKARIRFQLKNTMPTDKKKALTHIRQLTEVIDTCDQRLDSGVSLTRIPTVNGNMVLGDINDRVYQVDLLREYLKTKLNITDQIFIDGIIKINNETNDLIKKDDFSRNIRWIPKRLSFDNMFSYGEGNEIDFSKMKDLVGLFAPNASGKSSINSILTFCLFDKTERENRAINIMNVNKTEFKCKFEFEIDTKRYFIERIGKSDKKGKVKVDVRFWKIENGQEIDLNGEQRKNTNEIIREYLGSYEDFVLTSLSVQNGKNNASIIDMGDSDRKDLFAQFMGLTIFDRLHTEANEHLKERLIMLRTYKNDDYTQKLVDYTNLIGQSETVYSNEVNNLTEIVKKKEKIQQDILDATKRLIKLDINIPLLTESMSLFEKAKIGVISFKDSISNKEKEIETVSGQLTPIETQISEFESKKVEELYNKLQELKNWKKDVENKREQLKLNFINDQKIYQKAVDLEYDPNCSFCVKNNGIVAKEAEDAKNRMEKMVESANTIKNELEFVEKEISKISWVQDAIIQSNKLCGKRNELKNNKIEMTEYINKLQNKLNKFEEEVKLHEKNIELYNKNIESIQINEKVNKLIEDYTIQLNQIEFLYKKKNKEVMDMNSKMSVCKNQILEINKKVEGIKLVEQEYKLYEAYCQAVSRDGIPFDVITATVPEVQNEVNNILIQLCEFTALFETDGKNIIPYIVYNDKKWLMSLTSGFERFALSLAIRVALINISNLQRPNFIILDEPFGVLDAENLSSIDTLFSYLKTYFDWILIISHIDSIKDIINNNIEITKDINGFSHVNC